jgi:glycosyltransferase involved in cell wall biosynthesis
VFHLFRVIFESAYKILKFRIDVIYYPPGAGTIPIVRDIATLLVLRRFRRKLILVFHASGLSEIVSTWKGARRWCFEKTFLYPDAAIQKSRLNPPDGEFVKAKAVYSVPNGWPDHFGKFRDRRAKHSVPVILFVGMVREDKGIGVLLDAAELLKQQGKSFLIHIVGEFTSEAYREQLLSELSRRALTDQVEFCGRKVGDEKWMIYRNADIFCFPTFYSSESFGNVAVEAMMFELPVVTTRWRGLPDIVDDGQTGYLVEIKNSQAVAERLSNLLDDESLRIRLGRNGREKYLKNFTVNRYLEETRNVILDVMAGRADETVSKLKQPKE